MTKYFPVNDLASIRQAEQAVYQTYKSVLEPYAARYSHHGVTLNVAISREPDAPEMDSAYKAYITCQGVDSNGKIVESADHDFCFDFAWFLSACDKGQVAVFTDVDDDVYDLMKTCDDYFASPY